MKIKKSKFAKLLTLALPIAAISIVTPVVLTSCGSSNSTTTPDKPDNGGSGGGSDTGGGSSGGGSTDTTQSYTASWKTDTSISGLSVTDNKATITLDKNQFGGTSISKSSKYADIVSSLSPNTSSTKSSEIIKEGTTSAPSTDSAKTLYSVLSGLINNVDKFNVKLSIDPNPVVFDFSNDSIGNSFNGQFELTPIKDINSATGTTNLNFTINNFDDSSNISNKLTWNTKAVEDALKKGQAGTGNNISDDAKPKVMGNNASAIIDLSSLTSNKPTYSQVMNELCNTSITGTEISKFITSSDATYDVSKAIFSSWAPTVDQKMIFTRIVIPNKNTSEPAAIMYLAYTGYTDDVGSAAWNRNLGYYDITKPSADLWDKKYNEPVINLGENALWDTSITSSTKASDIINKKEDLVNYISTNYILDVGNFELDSTVDSAKIGKFDDDGAFVPNESKMSKVENQDESSSIITKNNNVIEIKFFLKLKGNTTELPKALDGTSNLSGYGKNNNDNGFWKAFYITGYNTSN